MSETGVVKIQSKYEKKYKCPYCDSRYTREKLVSHIDKKHEEMIPQDYTATRVVFNLVNKKTRGSCIICGQETKWNEEKARYERICDKSQCMEKYKEITAERLFNKYHKTKEDFLNDPEFQNKMLANRSISGKYKFSDGGVMNYVGSYEKKFLEFMDKFFHVSTKDLISPGPIIEYKFNGETHKWITDFYYEPYNLVFDIKDGGENPNNREMAEYREKQNAKEKAIADLNQYNYIRLTNNQFDQMILLMMELKDSLVETQYDTNKKHIIRINEGYLNNINTVIFDIGSVLVQQIPLEIILRNNGSFIPESLVDDLVSIWCSSGTETCTIDEQINTACKKAYDAGLQGPMKQYFSHIAQASLNNIEICDYTMSMLSKLRSKGYKLYILSNWGKWHFERLKELDKFKFLSYFDGGIVSYQVGLKKPDIKIYKMLIDKYNIDPLTAIFYDDKVENVEAAKKVGLNAVVFDRSVADIIINSSDIHCFDRLNESSRTMKKELYFLSDIDLDGKTLQPRIPSNYFTKNGYEENRTSRVCFSPSIDQCLMGLSQNLKGREFYVHIPYYDQEIEIYKPTKDEVPDCKITGEVWVKDYVKVNCIGKIRVVKDKDLPGHKFKYGDKEAELYDWEWEWIEKFKTPLNESPSTLDPNHKTKKTNKKFKFMDVKNPNVDKYLKQDKYCVKYLDYIHSSCIGEIVIDIEEDKIAGYVFIDNKKYPGFITPIEVIEEYRGYGLGSKLIKDAINKYNAVDLCVDKDNEIAIKLYKDNGFVIIGDGNSKKQYWMKLRSKLKKSEMSKIVEEVYINENYGHIMNKIVEFNDKLNQYEYIIIGNGKVITRIKSEDFSKYYKYMRPKDFEKYNGGICWDYVMYEANWFSENIPSVKFKTYFVAFEANGTPTHTFLLFFLGNKCYWFESSWKNHIGIYEFRNEDDALSYIIKELEPRGGSKYTFVAEYNAIDERLYGMSDTDFIKFMLDLQEKSYKKTNSKPLSIIKGNLRYDDIFYEACKDVETARRFVRDVGKLAKKYDANYFIVTDGASGTSNNGNPAVTNARKAQIEWEKKNGFDPDEDWSKDYIKESVESLNEFISSSVIDDYESKQDMRINKFTKITLSDTIIQVYKPLYTTLSHVRINKNTKGFAWLDDKKLVAIINTEKKDDDYVWINAFEIFDPYKGHGLSKQILRIAIKELEVTHLSVNKNNKVAYELYKKCGFKVYKETEKMYFMSIH